MLRGLLLVTLLLLGAPLRADAPTILVLGDSLSAAYGMDEGDGWVRLLEDRIAAASYPHRVVNASVSGDTTRGGRGRLPDALERHRPDIVIIQLGGNDGLRGQPVDAMRDNLEAMVRAGRDAGARVLLVGVRIPPNYGSAYTERFQNAYREVADALDVALVPRLLEGVGERMALMQADGVHPTPEAQPAMLDNVWPALETLLEPAH